MGQVTLTEADNGKSVQAQPGDLLITRLSENPTTGYRWAVDEVNPEVMTLVNSDYAQAPGSGIGGGGQKTFTFKALRAGSSPIQLKLWREWEGDNSITQRFGVMVRIGD